MSLPRFNIPGIYPSDNLILVEKGNNIFKYYHRDKLKFFYDVHNYYIFDENFKNKSNFRELIPNKFYEINNCLLIDNKLYNYNFKYLQKFNSQLLEYIISHNINKITKTDKKETTLSYKNDWKINNNGSRLRYCDNFEFLEYFKPAQLNISNYVLINKKIYKINYGYNFRNKMIYKQYNINGIKSECKVEMFMKLKKNEFKLYKEFKLDCERLYSDEEMDIKIRNIQRHMKLKRIL